jgi:CTP:molybdopterin cytidylyltransferase MocA
VPTTVYKLEHELSGLRKALEEIEDRGLEVPEAEEISRNIDRLESIISVKASTKSEAELMAAAEKWFKSLE